MRLAGLKPLGQIPHLRSRELVAHGGTHRLVHELALRWDRDDPVRSATQGVRPVSMKHMTQCRSDRPAGSVGSKVGLHQEMLGGYDFLTSLVVEERPDLGLNEVEIYARRLGFD